MATTIFATFIGTLATFVLRMDAVQLPPIYWNSSSETFISNVDNVLTVRLMDTVDIHCPFYNDTVTQDEAEYSLIYSVSKEGYEDCFLDKNAQPIAQCRSPFGVESVMKLTFRDYSPLPNAIEFEPGNTYYFISTSDGSLDGLRNRKGGLCLKSHMRMKVKVEDRHEPKLTAVAPESVSEVGRHKTSQDDDVRKTISHAADHFYATGRAPATLRKQAAGEDAPATKEDETVDVKFIADDNEIIQSTPPSDAVALDMDTRPQSDGRTNTLIYDPYGIEVSGGGKKRDPQSWPRHKWHSARGEGNEVGEDPPFLLYEIHEMDAQTVNRYERTSAALSRSSWAPLLLAGLFIILISRWISL